ncbi:hypothetical protein [Pseudomonas aeruginosa]|uniref:hypothetical protein n=1 Tax=Pseudomonas aeruginosa TaxID=287 RepID=UPI001BC925B0|nr:hypothetical protein [Pseudomonas aeruginosa]
MAKAKVVHSDDAVEIQFFGNPKKPEPSTAVIKFPGGHVEVSRCSDGSYFAHLSVVDPSNIIASRMDYSAEAWRDLLTIPEVPRANEITKIALRIANTVPHFDPDA